MVRRALGRPLGFVRGRRWSNYAMAGAGVSAGAEGKEALALKCVPVFFEVLRSGSQDLVCWGPGICGAGCGVSLLFGSFDVIENLAIIEQVTKHGVGLASIRRFRAVGYGEPEA